ncbi:1,4-alpha-glucan branching enzyme [Methylovorus sp. MM2]|uniref:1,4-alpha-glucan branching protein GlgB n=1 Tax=Methylovorus sp. MM2 TaxID=1848038 RepID=UPI0007E21AAE|nr:1,4-alpha-glucan branching protein GlgB [Methylovorus sp. MM2]OAM53062.1 1,4-alpha-glucan branching enzyme [Methylovorus sp. MM2]
MIKILGAKHHDPFSYLGLHQKADGHIFRAFLPHASRIWLKTSQAWELLHQTHEQGLYEWEGLNAPETPCRLKIEQDTYIYEQYDAYSFPSMLFVDDLYLFSGGNLKQAHKTFGAHMLNYNGITGVRFSVWAPNAERVSVVGNFNQWDGRLHVMRAHGSSGVWEIFIPELNAGELYKFEIRNRHTGQVFIKTDPYAFSYEHLPGTAAKITPPNQYDWQDAAWFKKREHADWLHTPFNCYEVHLGSWRRNADNGFLTYRELADQLVKYVKEMGYTHIELLPVSEHPLNESWGYQTTGYFAATHRFGTPDDLRYFVDTCHQADIGVILDWVPGHFPKDDWALARFDGTPLYEHADPRRGEHQEWGTYIFNYGRNEVRNFLVANAYFWLSEFHIDGLRVDAVASMLYLDYSRKAGEWLPNQFGGRENIEAIEFLKQLNIMVHQDFPGALTIAEESTAWPMVSRPVDAGGLGFSMKWNMGWMNDTLSYIAQDPIHRRYQHDKLTFGQIYAYSENFVLPFSHDEVVHGKFSLLGKMPGDAWQKFANIRLLLTYQMTTPGKKLNFMGNEFAQGREWNEGASLDWHLLDIPWHSGVQNMMRDLNHLYQRVSALHDLDFEQQGFDWIDCQDAEQSIISYIRRARDGRFIIVILNFTPVPRHHYRLGVPTSGDYKELFNSDAEYYGGSNQGNGAGLNSEPTPWMGYNQSIALNVPPLSGLILQLK